MVWKRCTTETHTKPYLCPTVGGITYLLHLLVLCTVKNPSNSPQHTVCCQHCLLNGKTPKDFTFDCEKDRLRKNNPFLPKIYIKTSNLSKFFKNPATKRVKL